MRYGYEFIRSPLTYYKVRPQSGSDVDRKQGKLGSRSRAAGSLAIR